MKSLRHALTHLRPTRYKKLLPITLATRNQKHFFANKPSKHVLL
jgi:hypothetical protein